MTLLHNTLIYLLGHYGVGKLTVAKLLVRKTGARLFDNHLINNVIFSLIEKNATEKFPDDVWNYIDSVRTVAIDAIKHLAPQHYSYVLTNALKNTEDDLKIFQKIERLAQSKKSAFFPVILTCSDDEICRRIVSAERSENFKFSDAQAALGIMKASPLIQISHENLLSLDTTALSAEETAQTILRHIHDKQDVKKQDEKNKPSS